MCNISGEGCEDRSVTQELNGGNDNGSAHQPTTSPRATTSFTGIPISSHQFPENLVQDQMPTTNLEYALTPDLSQQPKLYSSGSRNTVQSGTTRAPIFPSQLLPATPNTLQASIHAGQSSFNMPEELIRIPSGASVQTHDFILEATGRSYQSFREGRYFLPNDPVSLFIHTPRLERI